MNLRDSRIDLQEDFSDQLTIHKSLDQEVIVTTVDKIRLCLIEHKQRLTAKREWTLPASVFATLIAALAAADFQDFIVPSPVWEALFILSAAGSFIWLCVAGTRAYRYRGQADIEDVVSSLKAFSVDKQRDIK